MWHKYLLATMLVVGCVSAYGFSNISNTSKSQYLDIVANKDTGDTEYLIKNPTNTEVEFWSKQTTTSKNPLLLPEDFSVKIDVREGGYENIEIYTKENISVPTYDLFTLNTTVNVSASNIAAGKGGVLNYTDEDGLPKTLQPNDFKSYDEKAGTIELYNKEYKQNGTVSQEANIPFDPSVQKLSPNSNRSITVKVTPKIGKLSRGGWGYSIDNVVCFGGVCYDEYAWYNTSYGKRNNITFNTTWLPENLTSFPVLVVINSSVVNYSQMKSDGSDIRFTDSDESTLLDHEIEYFNASGNSYIWVRVPQLDGAITTDKIQMYWNCTSTCADAQNPVSLWNNSGYMSVWHMNNNPAAGGEALKDSIGKANGTNLGSIPSTAAIDTPTGRGIVFDGIDDRFNLTAYISYLQPSSTLQNIVAVYYLNGNSTTQQALIGGSSVIGNNFIRYETAGTNRYVRANTTTNNFVTLVGTPQVGTWNIMTGNEDGSKKTIYMNQTLEINASSSGTNSPLIGQICIASNPTSGCTGSFYNGTFDEARWSNHSFSYGFVNATYRTIFQNFNSYSATENAPTGNATCTGTSDCSVNCGTTTTITSNVNVGGFKITFTNAGSLSVSARIYNYTAATAQSSCKVYTTSSGKLG